MDIPIDSILAALSRRISDDARTIALLQAQVEQQDLELTKLRSEQLAPAAGQVPA